MYLTQNVPILLGCGGQEISLRWRLKAVTFDSAQLFCSIIKYRTFKLDQLYSVCMTYQK